MEEFKKYIRGEAGSVDPKLLSDISARWPWFVMPGIIQGNDDTPSAIHRLFHLGCRDRAEAKEIATAYNNCIIDRFLDAGNYKIDTETDAAEVCEPQGFEVDEDEMLTEELAQVYLSQGLFEQAKQIYRRLSLLYPKKSIYFAELIERIDKENKQLK